MSVEIPSKMKEMIEYCGEILDDYTYSIDTETNGSNFFQSGRVTDNTPYSFMEWLKSAKLSEEFNTVLKDKDGLNKEKNPYYFFAYLT